MEEDTKILLKLVDVLDAFEIPYLIGGSFASSAHGLSRATQDADLLVDIRKEHVERFVQAIEKDFYVEPDAISAALNHHTSFNMIDYATGFKIDIFIPRDREFDRRQFANRIYAVILSPDQKAYIASAEDTVLSKLEWYKLGDEVSDRQWNDIIGVIKLQGCKLDIAYMRKIARELDVLALLERALEANRD